MSSSSVLSKDDDSASFPVDLSNPMVHAGLKVGVVTLLHPMDYAKTLIQIGKKPRQANYSGDMGILRPRSSIL